LACLSLSPLSLSFSIVCKCRSRPPLPLPASPQPACLYLSLLSIVCKCRSRPPLPPCLTSACLPVFLSFLSCHEDVSVAPVLPSLPASPRPACLSLSSLSLSHSPSLWSIVCKCRSRPPLPLSPYLTSACLSLSVVVLPSAMVKGVSWLSARAMSRSMKTASGAECRQSSEACLWSHLTDLSSYCEHLLF
jgi:hypothetical protein